MAEEILGSGEAGALEIVQRFLESPQLSIKNARSLQCFKVIGINAEYLFIHPQGLRQSPLLMPIKSLPKCGSDLPVTRGGGRGGGGAGRGRRGRRRGGAEAGGQGGQ